MPNRKSVLITLFATALLLLGATSYKVVARYPVPGNGSFDYVAIDTSARRIYVSHGTQVDVIDADSGKVVGTIADTPGVHGTAIASEFKHGFTSNGREDKVSMFDPATLQLIKKIDVGKGPDGIYYDAATKRVFTNNHGSHDITAIDGKTGEVVGTVKADGDGEEAVIGADGLIYVNSENTRRCGDRAPAVSELGHGQRRHFWARRSNRSGLGRILQGDHNLSTVAQRARTRHPLCPAAALCAGNARLVGCAAGHSAPRSGRLHRPTEEEGRGEPEGQACRIRFLEV